MTKALAVESPAPAVPAVLWGGLAAGVLDLADALVFHGLKGVPPIRIPQSIASGLLGRSAYEGGMATAALGTALHFFIALTVAAVYFGASRRFPRLVQQPVRWGLLYGVGVYAVMECVVVPLSRAAFIRAFPWPVLLNGLLGHALLVGLPIALCVRRTAQQASPVPER